MDNKNAIEELAFIKRVIDESRQSVIYGWSFLVWGSLVSVGLIFTYISIYNPTVNSLTPWIWVSLIIIGWSFSGYESFKNRNPEKKCTFVDKITSAVWFSFGITATIFGMIGMFTNAYDGAFVSPLISTAIGTAYFITGVIHKTNWLRNLSFGWWSGALIMFLWPAAYILLLMAAMMVLLQIVPGLILQKNITKQHVENND